jgi:RNase H-like domain found in reverse transcriptase/Reverse transcriptase (RNA-dependent DNA polymerase)/Integrase zinc binding domain
MWRLIFPTERRIVLKESSTVDIIPSTSAASGVHLVKDYLVPAFCEFVVNVVTQRAGLSEIRPAPMRKRRIIASNGIADIPISEAFSLKIANFSDRGIFLRAGTVVAYASELQSGVRIVTDAQPADEESEKWRQEVGVDQELPEDIRAAVFDVLDRRSDMWTGLRPGDITCAEHRIKTNGRPVRLQPYRAGPYAREAEKTEVERMLSMGVIEPSSSEWAAPVVLVPKADGGWRFCVDYRRLNAITERDVYPLPRMDKCLDSLGDAYVFSTLDANAGYWQVKVAAEDRDKTSFTCHVGTFRFLRMPFGLVNAPSTFQRAMDVILSRVKWRFALVYLDEVIVFSQSYSQHLSDLADVLDLLRNAGVTLRLKKCHFFKKRVKYLGHIVTPGKLEVDDRNTMAIQMAKIPVNRTELRSFLGLCNVYRRFVPNFARRAASLTKLLRGKVPDRLELDQEAVDSFEDLKSCLCAPPVLSLPRAQGELVLDTDASDAQLGCCLQQRDDDNQFHPLGYWSRQLNQAEQRYSATEKEALAVVWSIKRLRPYLEATRFTVRTDHAALTWLFDVDGDNRRLARWRLCLAEYDFTVKHRLGVIHQPADGLSRLRTEGHDESDLGDEIPCIVVADESEGTRTYDPISIEELLTEQSRDQFCQDIVAKDNVLDSNGCVCRKDPRSGRLQLCVPTSLRVKVMSLGHNPPLAGHPGAKRMYQTLSRVFVWPKMAFEIACVVRSKTPENPATYDVHEAVPAFGCF